jgi:quercetin dioxygenase-like cupin family protein
VTRTHLAQGGLAKRPLLSPLIISQRESSTPSSQHKTAVDQKDGAGGIRVSHQRENGPPTAMLPGVVRWSISPSLHGYTHRAPSGGPARWPGYSAREWRHRREGDARRCLGRQRLPLRKAAGYTAPMGFAESRMRAIAGGMPGRLTPGRFFGTVQRRREVGGFALVECAFSPGLRLPSHSHETAFFYFVLDGASTESTSGADRGAAAGTLVFYPAGEPHANHWLDTGGRCLHLELSPVNHWGHGKVGCRDQSPQDFDLHVPSDHAESHSHHHIQADSRGQGRLANSIRLLGPVPISILGARRRLQQA